MFGMKPVESPEVTASTKGVTVRVRSVFVPEQSSARQRAYVFAYRVTIENNSQDVLQLLSRHWDIVDGWSETRIVEGEGVIGRQPTLYPGDVHTYTSGCVFPTEIGQMSGHYVFRRESDGRHFKVRIPAFVMHTPALLN